MAKHSLRGQLGNISARVRAHQFQRQIVVALLLILDMVDHLLSCFQCPEDFYDMFTNNVYSPLVCIFGACVYKYTLCFRSQTSKRQELRRVKDKRYKEPHLCFTVYKKS